MSWRNAVAWFVCYSSAAAACRAQVECDGSGFFLFCSKMFNIFLKKLTNEDNFTFCEKKCNKAFFTWHLCLRNISPRFNFSSQIETIQTEVVLNVLLMEEMVEEMVEEMMEEMVLPYVFTALHSSCFIHYSPSFSTFPLHITARCQTCTNRRSWRLSLRNVLFNHSALHLLTRLTFAVKERNLTAKCGKSNGCWSNSRVTDIDQQVFQSTTVHNNNTRNAAQSASHKKTKPT